MLTLGAMTPPKALPGGRQVMSLGDYYYTFRLKHPSPDGLPYDVCPPAVILHSANHAEALYCGLLCALVERPRLKCMLGTFAGLVVGAFKDLEANWGQYVGDVRTGKVSEERVTVAHVRDAVEERLGGPNPELAAELDKLFREGFEGVIPKLWPNLVYIQCVLTGPASIHAEPLRR